MPKNNSPLGKCLRFLPLSDSRVYQSSNYMNFINKIYERFLRTAKQLTLLRVYRKKKTGKSEYDFFSDKHSMYVCMYFPVSPKEL